MIRPDTLAEKQQSQIDCPARAKSPLTRESSIQVSCEPDFFGSDFRKGQVAMARLVTSSCTGASRKLCGRSVVNWRASVHSGRRAEALANAEEAGLRLTQLRRFAPPFRNFRRAI